MTLIKKSLKLRIEDYETLAEVNDFIVSNLSRHYTIQDLAHKARTNERKLKTSFRQVYGLGIYAYLKSERMKQAKFYLETTDKSVLEIARLVGYRSMSSFSTAFRKQYGIPPRDIRMTINKISYPGAVSQAG